MKETTGRLPDRKARLRKRIRALEFSLSNSYVADSNMLITSTLLQTPEYLASDLILTYVSIDKEPDTYELMKHALGEQKRVAVPVSSGRGQMDFFEIRALSDLSKKDAFGIPVPEITVTPVTRTKNTVAIVPGVCFTMNGDRLGRGAGFYDRYLQSFPNPTIGLCRFALLRDTLPVLPHDLPVDIVVTEVQVYRRKMATRMIP